MPSALRAVAPAYTALAPGGAGPWLPEPGAKRAWPDSVEDSVGYAGLNLEALELWEPQQKRLRLGERWAEDVEKPGKVEQEEAFTDSSLKRQTASAEELSKRRRLVAVPTPQGSLAVLEVERCGERGEGRRVVRRTQQATPPEAQSAPEVLGPPEVPAASSGEEVEEVLRSDAISCTDIVACAGMVPQGAARILSCIRDAFMPCSLDFRDAFRPWRQPDLWGRAPSTLPVRVDADALKNMGILSLSAEYPQRMSLDSPGLPGLVLFRNGKRCIEPMEKLLLYEADEPVLPGFVLCNGRRRTEALAPFPGVPAPHYGLRLVEDQREDEDEDEDEEDEGILPMAIA